MFSGGDNRIYLLGNPVSRTAKSFCSFCNHILSFSDKIKGVCDWY